VTEEHLRSLIREVVARHLSSSSVGPSIGVTDWKTHPSHHRLPVLRGDQGEGPCLVEPVVRCHHCGFCQSFGH
jgi:hypothetical protein